jgi:hypothetical protein
MKIRRLSEIDLARIGPLDNQEKRTRLTVESGLQEPIPWASNWAFREVASGRGPHFDADATQSQDQASDYIPFNDRENSDPSRRIDII